MSGKRSRLQGAPEYALLSYPEPLTEFWSPADAHAAVVGGTAAGGWVWVQAAGRVVAWSTTPQTMVCCSLPEDLAGTVLDGAHVHVTPLGGGDAVVTAFLASGRAVCWQSCEVPPAEHASGWVVKLVSKWVASDAEQGEGYGLAVGEVCTASVVVRGPQETRHGDTLLDYVCGGSKGSLFRVQFTVRASHVRVSKRFPADKAKAASKRDGADAGGDGILNKVSWLFSSITGGSTPDAEPAAAAPTTDAILHIVSTGGNDPGSSPTVIYVLTASLLVRRTLSSKIVPAVDWVVPLDPFLSVELLAGAPPGVQPPPCRPVAVVPLVSPSGATLVDDVAILLALRLGGDDIPWYRAIQPPSAASGKLQAPLGAMYTLHCARHDGAGGLVATRPRSLLACTPDAVASAYGARRLSMASKAGVKLPDPRGPTDDVVVDGSRVQAVAGPGVVAVCWVPPPDASPATMAVVACTHTPDPAAGVAASAPPAWSVLEFDDGDPIMPTSFHHPCGFGALPAFPRSPDGGPALAALAGSAFACVALTHGDPSSTRNTSGAGPVAAAMPAPAAPTAPVPPETPAGGKRPLQELPFGGGRLQSPPPLRAGSAPAPQGDDVDANALLSAAFSHFTDLHDVDGAAGIASRLAGNAHALNDATVALSTSIVNKRPPAGQAWSVGADTASDMPHVIRFALQTKCRRHAALLSFLRGCGLWPLLTVRTRRELASHGEKLRAAMELAALEGGGGPAGAPGSLTSSTAGTTLSGGDATILHDAMQLVVENIRGVSSDLRRRAGLSIQDVFYSEVSMVQQLVVTALRHRLAEAHPHGGDEPSPEFPRFVAAVNKVALCVLGEAVAFRDTYGAAYDHGSPTAPPGALEPWWTGDDAMLHCLRSFVDATEKALAFRRDAVFPVLGKQLKELVLLVLAADGDAEVTAAATHGGQSAAVARAVADTRADVDGLVAARMAAAFDVDTHIPLYALSVVEKLGDHLGMVRVCDAIDARSGRIDHHAASALAAPGGVKLLELLERFGEPLAGVAVQEWLRALAAMHAGSPPDPWMAAASPINLTACASKILQLPAAYDAVVAAALGGHGDSVLCKQLLSVHSIVVQNRTSTGDVVAALQAAAMNLHGLGTSTLPEAADAPPLCRTAISIAKLASRASGAAPDSVPVALCDKELWLLRAFSVCNAALAALRRPTMARSTAAGVLAACCALVAAGTEDAPTWAALGLETIVRFAGEGANPLSPEAAVEARLRLWTAVTEVDAPMLLRCVSGLSLVEEEDALRHTLLFVALSSPFNKGAAALTQPVLMDALTSASMVSDSVRSAVADKVAKVWELVRSSL